MRLMRCYALLGERSRARKDGRAGVGGGIKECSYDEPRRNRRLRQGASRKRLNRDLLCPTQGVMPNRIESSIGPLVQLAAGIDWRSGEGPDSHEP